MVLEDWRREGTNWETRSGGEWEAQIKMWFVRGWCLHGYEDERQSANGRGWDVGSSYMNRQRHGIGNHSRINVCIFTCDTQHWGYRPWGGHLQWIVRNVDGPTGKPTHPQNYPLKAYPVYKKCREWGSCRDWGNNQWILAQFETHPMGKHQSLITLMVQTYACIQEHRMTLF